MERKNRLQSPQAGPFAETAAFVRLAVADGRMSAEEGLRLSNQAYLDSMVTQLLECPVETDSIQLPKLITGIDNR